MRKSVIIVLCFFVITGFAAAQVANDPAGLFDSASGYFEKKDYDKALSLYLKILDQGVESGNLYYNIGSCYLHKGDIGRAVLNFERARLFIPHDSDLLANYRYARSKMKQRDVQKRVPLWLKKINSYFASFTFTEITIGVFACLYLFAAFFIGVLFVKRVSILMGFFAFFFFCAIIILIMPLGEKAEGSKNKGIVVASIADARIEPFEDAESRFPLYGGMSVNVLKQIKGWSKVKRPDGKIGWVEKGNVDLVKPKRY